MANPDGPNGFRAVETDSGQMAVRRYPVAASQTIAKGDAVFLSSGLVTIAVATTPQLLGIAASAVTTTASPVRATDTVMVYVATPGQIFEGQCSGSSTAALLGTSCDIEGTTGIMEINENATTEDVIHIVGWKSDEDPKLALGANDIGRFIIIRSQYCPMLAAK